MIKNALQYEINPEDGGINAILWIFLWCSGTHFQWI